MVCIIWEGYRYRLDGIHTHKISKNREAVHIRYRAKKKGAEDTCVRPSKIKRSDIQVVGEEALQPNDLQGKRQRLTHK